MNAFNCDLSYCQSIHNFPHARASINDGNNNTNDMTLANINKAAVVVANEEYGNNNDNELLGADVAHIHGTDVHVHTAARAFTDFLRTYCSLRISQRQQTEANRNLNDNANESDDLDSDTSPLYFTKL
jgi:hypothetical protein